MPNARQVVVMTFPITFARLTLDCGQIIVFWAITSIQLAFLTKTLPLDQERMETELADYAMASMDVGYGSVTFDDSHAGGESCLIDPSFDCDGSIFSIENQRSSFDGMAASAALQFVGDSLREIRDDRLPFLRRARSERRGVAGGSFAERIAE